MKSGQKVLLGVFVFLFIAGGVNHFIAPGFYLKLLDYILPAGNEELAKQLVMVSGVTEILAGLLFILPQTRRWGALFILLHLLAFVPVHVAMCFVRVSGEDPNVAYFAWPRLIVQFMLIYWIALFTQKPLNQTK